MKQIACALLVVATVGSLLFGSEETNPHQVETLSEEAWRSLNTSFGNLLGDRYSTWNTKKFQLDSLNLFWKKAQTAVWVYDRNGNRQGKEITHWTEEEPNELKQDCDTLNGIDPISFLQNSTHHQTNSDAPGKFVKHFNLHASNWPLYKVIEELKTDSSMSRWNARFEQKWLELDDLEKKMGSDKSTLDSRKSYIASELSSLRDQVKITHAESQLKKQQEFTKKQQKELETFIQVQKDAKQQFDNKQKERERLFESWRNKSREAIDSLDSYALSTVRGLVSAVVAATTSLLK